MLRITAVAAAALVLAAWVAPSFSADGSPAEEVTILRDDFGIPNIFAETAEGAVYGAGYAQAEDRLHELLKQYRRCEGTMSEVFGAKEGKIGKASRGREPVYLFSALQRQLGYPEVPKPNQRDDLKTKLDVITGKLKELEQRLRLAEGGLRGGIDLSQLGKPDILKKDDEE